jgi:hypothetical protein
MSPNLSLPLNDEDYQSESDFSVDPDNSADPDNSDHEGESVELSFEEYLLAKRDNFPIFFVNLSDSLKTDTPDWYVVLDMLHYMWCNYDNPEEDIIFWGISKETCKIFQDFQERSFESVDYEMYSDGLIDSNETGVSLDRIMLSYLIMINHFDIRYYMNVVLTTEMVKMFIDQLYFDDYIHRNELIMIEKGLKDISRIDFFSDECDSYGCY